METVEGPPRFLARQLEALAPLWLLQVVMLAAFLSWLPDVLRGRCRGPRIALGLPLALLAVLAAVQLIPGSATLLSAFSPELGATRAALGVDDWAPFTVWPYGTRVALLTLLGVLVVQRTMMVTVADDGAGRRLARRVLWFVFAVAALECGIGIASTHLGDDTVLGLAKVSGRGRVTGTFVLAPMLGVWAGMGACAGVGLAMLAWRRDARRSASVCGVLVAVCVAGAVLSLSRLMLAATAGGLIVTLWLAGGSLATEGRTRVGRALRGAAVALPIAVVAVVLLVPSLRERVAFALPYVTGEPGPVEPRIAGWESTWDLFRLSPWIGTGLGSFGRAVHLTQSIDAPQEMWFAHSDPLNLLADGGVLAFGLAMAWLVSCWRHGRIALRSAQPETRLLAAAAIGGAVVVLVGALADFQTQFPVVALPFVALAVLPTALAAPRDPSTDEIWMGRRRVGTTVVAVVLIVAFGFTDSLRERTAHIDAGHPPAPTTGEMALGAARTLLSGLRSSDDPGADLEEAERLLTVAVEEEPFLDDTHLWRALVELSTPDGSRDLALEELGRARLVSRGHAGVNLQIGLLYLDLLGTSEAEHGPAGDTAMDALREAGALVPQAFSRAFAEALQRELTGDDLRRIVPERAHALERYAGHLGQAGDATGQRAALRRALSIEPWNVALVEKVVRTHEGTSDEAEARDLISRFRLE